MASLECRNRAVALLAEQAARYDIGPAPEGDIKEIVPPVREFSRKMQQDPAVLDATPRLGLPPLLPKADQVRQGREQVSAR